MSDEMTNTILNALRNVIDPELHKDIVSLGFVKNVSFDNGNVSVTIELTTPACPLKERMKNEALQFLKQIPGVKNVEVKMTAQVQPTRNELKEKLIPTVKNVIPIASGKGGVGKSTVAAYIAVELMRRGAKVGLMDGDFYGPSIPLIMGVTEKPFVKNEKIIPVEKHNIKIISMGFFLAEGEAVIWRGPMLHKVVQDFLGIVEWGEIDYLIVDLPPGTGDVQLSLCQTIPLTGAVIVSTPMDVALNVAKKAIFMFNKLNCPILGLIENMSCYVCPSCGNRDNIFGYGKAEETCKQLEIPYLGSVPLTSELSKATDEGKSLILTESDSVIAKAFKTISENLAARISVITHLPHF